MKQDDDGVNQLVTTQKIRTHVMAPITTSIDISEIETRLLAQGNICNCPRNLPSHERPSLSQTFVIEQDPVACIHAVRFTVVDDNPVGVELGAAIGRSRVERRSLTLGSLYNLPIKLGCGCLVEFDMFLESTSPDSVEKTEGSQSVNIGSVFSHFKGDLDVLLGAKVVNLCWLDLGKDVNKIGAIAAIMQLESVGICWLGVTNTVYDEGFYRNTYIHVDLCKDDGVDQC